MPLLLLGFIKRFKVCSGVLIAIEDLLAIPLPGALMGLDVGDKTVGLSLSDRRRQIASPYKTLVRHNFKKIARDIVHEIHSVDVGGLVMGLPLNMNGSESAQTQKTRQFMQNFLNFYDVPVLLWDERFSTQAVIRMMIHEADLSRKKQKKNVDKLAASFMLQGALDALRQLSKATN